MSIKSQVYNALLQGQGPANMYAFQVTIPGALKSSLLVEAATYPSLKRGDVAVPVRGTVLNIPTVEESTGVWNCTIVETQTFMTKWDLMKVYLNTDPSNLIDIELRPLQAGGVLPMVGIKMSGCYLQSRGEVRLASDQVTNVWKWDFSFVFNLIEEVYGLPDIPLVSDVKVLASVLAGRLL